MYSVFIQMQQLECIAVLYLRVEGFDQRISHVLAGWLSLRRLVLQEN
jgi:hypothetical protein